MKKRKDGRWCKVLTLNGKRIYFYSSEKTEKRAAADIQRQILTYTEKEEKGKTFAEVADEWEEQHYPQIEYSTAHRYESLLKHMREDFSDRYIKDITPADIERHINRFAVERYATKSIKDQMSVVRLVFRFAYIKGYIASDPTQYVSTPKGQASKKREPLTDEEIAVVRNSVDCTFGLFPYFLLYTGLRKGEALALQYKDIDFEHREIHVTKSVYHVSNKPYIKGTKTQNSVRSVVLPDILANKLPRGNADEYVFHDSKNNPLSSSGYRKCWEQYCKETGLNITAHQLRHTYATILFEADIDVKDAQHLMGHSDIAVTRNIYTHIRENRLRDTAEKLNKFIA